MESIDSIRILGILKTEKLVSVPVGTLKAVKRGQKHNDVWPSDPLRLPNCSKHILIMDQTAGVLA